MKDAVELVEHDEVLDDRGHESGFRGIEFGRGGIVRTKEEPGEVMDAQHRR